MIRFFTGLCSPVLDSDVTDVLFNRFKKMFMRETFDSIRVPFLALIAEIANKSPDNAMRLMHTNNDIQGFVLEVLKSEKFPFIVKTQSLKIIANIVSHGEAFAIRFSCSEVVQFLCKTFEEGSFDNRIIALDFFLAIMDLPHNDILANLLELSNVLSFCPIVLESMNYPVITRSMTVFHSLWRSIIIGRRSHSFYKHFLEMFEDPNVIDCLIDLAHCEDRDASEAARSFIALLNDYGKEIEIDSSLRHYE